MKEGLSNLRPLLPYLKAHRRTHLLGLLCILMAQGAGLFIPWALKGAIDSLKGPQSRQILALSALAIVGLALFRAVFQFLMRRFFIGVAKDVEYAVRNDLFAHLQKLPPAFYSKMKTGDLISRTTNDLTAIRLLVGPGIMFFLSTAVLMAFSFIMMCILYLPLAFLSLLPTPFVALFVKKVGQKVHHQYLKVEEGLAQLSAMAQENLSNMKVIKAYNLANLEEEAFWKLSQSYRDKNIVLAKLWGLLFGLFGIIASFGTLAVLWYGGRKVITGELTLGEFVAFNGYLMMLAWPTVAMGWVLNLFERGAASMARLKVILDEPPQEKGPALFPSDGLEGDIEIVGLHFSYPEQKEPFLKDINLRVKKGSRVAIVGLTGSGKTTLLNLLLRLWEAEEGKIYLSRRPIKEVSLKVLREKLAMVPQESFLFSATLSENIAFGRPEAHEEEVVWASEVAKMRDEAESFPEGFKTLIGERGINLSGGQRQRTALARALLLRSSVLIMDDCLSCVDVETEEEIWKALKEAMKGKTIIFSTQRLKSAMAADEVVVLKDGHIVQRGTHQKLIKEPGIYRLLYERQLLMEQLQGP